MSNKNIAQLLNLTPGQGQLQIVAFGVYETAYSMNIEATTVPVLVVGVNVTVLG